MEAPHTPESDGGDSWGRWDGAGLKAAPVAKTSGTSQQKQKLLPAQSLPSSPPAPLPPPSAPCALEAAATSIIIIISIIIILNLLLKVHGS